MEQRRPTRRLHGILLAFSVLAASVGLTAQAAPAHAVDQDLNQYVDLYLGSDKEPDPNARAPFGNLAFRPTTEASWTRATAYKYSSTTMRGFTVTGIFMPTSSAVTNPASGWSAFAASFDRATETVEPGYYGVTVNNTIVKAAASSRSVIAEYDYPATGAARLLLSQGEPTSGLGISTVRGAQLNINTTARTISGFQYSERSGYRYKTYFYHHFSQPFTAHGTWNGDTVTAGSTTVDNANGDTGAYLEFAAGSAVTVRSGESTVSVANAQLNADTEIPTGTTLTSVRQNTYDAWNAYLNRVQVGGGTTTDKVKFYTNLYYSISLGQFRVANDVNGQFLDFRKNDPNTNLTRTATDYTRRDFLLMWDYNRGLTQFMAAFFPEVAEDVARTLLDTYTNHGIIPRGLFNGVADGLMEGDPGAEALTMFHSFGADGFDANAALDAMTYQSNNWTHHASNTEREYVFDYVDKGYVPYATGRKSASTSIEYYHDDFAIAYLAQSLGDTATYTDYLARANNWKRLFDPDTKWIRPRNADGSWLTPYSPDDYTGFAEGSPKSYTQDLTFNQADYINLIGLAEAQTRAPAVAGLVNEPSWADWTVGAWTDQSWKVADASRQIFNAYGTGTDNAWSGELDATLQVWGVWAGLGMFPSIWGTDYLIIGSPWFDTITINIPGHPTATITANGNSSSNKYIQAATVNGVATQKNHLRWTTDILAGKDIVYTMNSSKTNAGVLAFGAGAANRPPSWSSDPAAPATPRTWTKVNENDSSVAFTGGWSTESNTNAYGGTARNASAAGAKATLSFTGVRARFSGYWTRNTGQFDVYVDGVYQQTIDTHRNGTQTAYDHMWYQTPLLTDAPHTLEIRVKGTRVPVSTSNTIHVDSFEYVAGGGATAPALQGHYRLDEASGIAVSDASGNGRSLTTTNAPTWVTGKAGNGLSFNGSTQYASGSWAQLTGNASRTIATWFKTTSAANSNWVSWGTNASNQLSQLGTNANAIGYLGFGNDLTVPAAPYADGQWHHLAVTFDGSSMRLYVDGIERGTKTTTLNTGAGNLNLGRSVSGLNYYAGSLDDVRIYSGALSPAEISALALVNGQLAHWRLDESTGSTADDASVNSRDATLSGAPAWGTGQVNNALTFNGSTQYASATWGQLTGNAPRTIATWFKTTSTANANWVSWGTNASNQLSQLGIFNTGLGYLGFANELTTPASSYADGQWHHLAVTFDGTTMRLYVDGIERNSKTTTLNTGSSTLNLGRSVTAAANQYYAGSLDEVRIFDRALPSTEITSLTR